MIYSNERPLALCLEEFLAIEKFVSPLLDVPLADLDLSIPHEDQLCRCVAIFMASVSVMSLKI